jgi:hypothetical protein
MSSSIRRAIIAAAPGSRGGAAASRELADDLTTDFAGDFTDLALDDLCSLVAIDASSIPSAQPCAIDRNPGRNLRLRY